VIDTYNSEEQSIEVAKKFFASNLIDSSDFRPFEDSNDDDHEKELLMKAIK
jgi:hypothetical protein